MLLLCRAAQSGLRLAAFASCNLNAPPCLSISSSVPRVKAMLPVARLVTQHLVLPLAKTAATSIASTVRPVCREPNEWSCSEPSSSLQVHVKKKTHHSDKSLSKSSHHLAATERYLHGYAPDVVQQHQDEQGPNASLPPPPALSARKRRGVYRM